MALDDIQWEAWKDVRARGSAIRELERALDNSGLSKEAQTARDRSFEREVTDLYMANGVVLHGTPEGHYLGYLAGQFHVPRDLMLAVDEIGPIWNTNIHRSEIDDRIYWVLDKKKIQTNGQLAMKTDRELLDIKGIADGSLTQIKDYLKAKGLTTGTNPRKIPLNYDAK